MRVLIWITVVFAVLWGGYWVIGSTAVERGVAQWFDDQTALGITANRDDISVAGFPSRLDLTITNPHLADPAAGWAWTAPFVQVLSMTWKPWHLIAALPNDQQVQVAGQKVDITSSKMAASVRVSPTSDIALQEAVIEGHDLLATSDAGWRTAAKSLVLALAPDPADPLAQRLGLRIADLVPAPDLAALVPDLGDTISTVHLDAVLTFSAPLDRHMAETQPRLTALTVTDLALTWGSLKLQATGQVDRAADGFASGQIDFQIENWRQIPALIVALGLVRPEMADAISRGVEALARDGGDPDRLNLPLVFADGRMSLGPLPLGAAPRLD
jgi:hypothetical protein